MKSSLRLVLLSFVIILLGLSSCDRKKELEPSQGVTVKSVTALVNGADVVLKTSKLVEYAYVLKTPSEDAISDVNVIFATGVKGELVDGENIIEIRSSNIEANTEFVTYFAFKSADAAYYEKVVEVNFTTTGYEEDFTILSSYADGFKCHFKVPQSVKDAGHAIRYSIGSYPMYMASKSGWGATIDPDVLLSNGQKHLLNDTIIVYDNSNVYEIDENGNEIIDEDTGEPIMLHLPFVPGEPIVFLAGEFAWGESDYSWGEGWYKALYDFDGYMNENNNLPIPWSSDSYFTPKYNFNSEDKFWQGYFTRKCFRLPLPEEMEDCLDINIQTTSTNGTIDITPSKDVYGFCYFLLSYADYEMYLSAYLDGKEDWMQWFLTSFTGSLFGCSSYVGSEPVTLKLSDLTYVTDDTEYHLLITALGNEKGTKQKYYHEVFSTKAKSMPLPEVKVTAIPNPSGVESPYQACFNVKCTTKDAKSVKYAANYVREFVANLNVGYSYNDIVGWGYSLSEDDVRKVNSDAGLNLTVSSMPGQTTMLGVLAYNEESSPNIITEESGALATCTTINEPNKPKVESELFTSLLGDWTLSAQSYYIDYYDNYKWKPNEGIQSVKLQICKGYTYPETLDDSVYALYSAMTKEEVDALYAEFKAEVDEFNAWLEGQNRLLCLGYGFKSTTNRDYFSTVYTPYDLFVDANYNGYDCNSLIWDSGIKWYLEIGADGKVTVPVNVNTQYPSYNYDSTLYLVGMDADATGYLGIGEDGRSDAHFPVVISDNTLTLKPYSYKGKDYYLAALMQSFNSFYTAGDRPIGDVTITRGWSGDESTSSVASVASTPKAIKSVVPCESMSNVKFVRKTALYPRAKRKVIEVKPFSMDDLQK